MIREIAKSDYPTLCRWWEAWKFPAPPIEMLPPTGYVVNDCAAGYMYLTNSSVVWLEWVVADPKAEKILRRDSLDILIEKVCKGAFLSGSGVVYTTTNNGPFMERLKRHGFFADTGGKTQHMFRRL